MVGATLNIPQYAGGGGGTFSGSLADTQVAFGNTTADSIQGSSSFTYDNTNKILAIAAGTGTPTLQSGSADLILRNSNAAAHSKITLGYDPANSDILLETDGTGLVNIYHEGVKRYSLPSVTTTSNDYVLTAQTDGSTAWAEAGGGGGGSDNIDFAGVRTTFAGNSRYNVGMQSPWVTGSNSVVTSGFAYTDDGFMWPFLYPLDGAITELGVTFGWGVTGGIKMAVYTSDSDGKPTTMLARGDIAHAGSGSTYTTTITGPSSGAASTATAGDLCWMAYTRYDASENTEAALGPSGNTSIIGPTAQPSGTSPNCYRFTAYDASTTWPDTLSTTTASVENNLRLRTTIKVA